MSARAETLEEGDAAGIAHLYRVALAATATALERGFYSLPGGLGADPHPSALTTKGSTHCVALADTHNRWPVPHWFGRDNVELMPPELGNDVPPPLLVTTKSPLDVAGVLRQHGLSGSLFVVADICNFDSEGRPDLRHPFGTHPADVAVRSDFSRFVESGHRGLRVGDIDFKRHLVASQDPYLFVSPEVCVFRGSRDEGFPFLEKPYSVHVLGASLSASRPALQEMLGRSGHTSWYASTADHTALVERLNLIALVALRVSGQDGTNTSSQELPTLILPALGFGKTQYHPREAFASTLKQWRRRFSPFFRSIYLCSDSPDLAAQLDDVVNRNIHRISESETLAARMVPWHWTEHELEMAHSSRRMFMAADKCAAATEARKREEERALSKLSALSAKTEEEQQQDYQSQSSQALLPELSSKRNYTGHHTSIAAATLAKEKSLLKEHFKVRRTMQTPQTSRVSRTSRPSEEGSLEGVPQWSSGDIDAPPATARALGKHESEQLRRQSLNGAYVELEALRPVDQCILLHERAKVEQVKERRNQTMNAVVGAWSASPGFGGSRFASTGPSLQPKQAEISIDAQLEIRRKARERLLQRAKATEERCDSKQPANDDGETGAVDDHGEQLPSRPKSSTDGRVFGRRRKQKRLVVDDDTMPVLPESAAIFAGQPRLASRSAAFDRLVFSEVRAAIADAQDMMGELNDDIPSDEDGSGQKNGGRGTESQVIAYADGLARKLDVSRRPSIDQLIVPELGPPRKQNSVFA